MGIISMIVAIDKNNAIGKGNQMLCHLPNDLKYFKEVTSNHSVIMGRKTFESLPKGALPNRRNLVISRNKNLQLPNCEVVDSLEKAIANCKNEEEVFIMGGGQIYKEALTLVDKLYVTHIHNTFDGAEVFFPEINKTIWVETWRQDNIADDRHKYDFSFVQYIKN